MDKKSTIASSVIAGEQSTKLSSSSGAAAASLPHSAAPPHNIKRKQRIFQNFLLIWLDSNINATNKDFRDSIIHLRSIVNTIATFIDVDQCMDYLRNIKDEQVLMIVSGALGQQIVPRIHDVSQLNFIFVFCGDKSRHEQWSKNWPKVKGVFTKINLICESVKQAARQCDYDSMPLSFISAHEEASNQNLNQLDSSLMFIKILQEILGEIEYNEQSIQNFAAYCRDKFTNNNLELNRIAQFEQTYHHRSPIWWYNSDGFLYSMLNRALRTHEVDTIIKMGFFIRDLHRNIEQLHSKQFGGGQKIPPFTVYQSQHLSMKNFEKLMKTKGGLISFNNFLSASKDRASSFAFAGSNGSNNLTSMGILFKMTIDPSVSTAPFAFLDKTIYHQKDDQDMLFSMKTVFRIGEITQIENKDRLWQVELTLIADNDQQLIALNKRMREETFPESKGWHRLAMLLIEESEFNRAEQVYLILLDQTHNDSEKPPLYNKLGWTKRSQGNDVEAISYFEKGLAIQQKSLPPNHSDLATFWNNIGMAYDSMGECSKAHLYYKKAFELQQKPLSPNHSNATDSCNNIEKDLKEVGFYQRFVDNGPSSKPPTHAVVEQLRKDVGKNLNPTIHINDFLLNKRKKTEQ